jgi:hypothetical protein
MGGALPPLAVAGARIEADPALSPPLLVDSASEAVRSALAAAAPRVALAAPGALTHNVTRRVDVVVLAAAPRVAPTLRLVASGAAPAVVEFSLFLPHAPSSPPLASLWLEIGRARQAPGAFEEAWLGGEGEVRGNVSQSTLAPPTATTGSARIPLDADAGAIAAALSGLAGLPPLIVQGGAVVTPVGSAAPGALFSIRYALPGAFPLLAVAALAPGVPIAPTLTLVSPGASALSGAIALSAPGGSHPAASRSLALRAAEGDVAAALAALLTAAGLPSAAAAGAVAKRAAPPAVAGASFSWDVEFPGADASALAAAFAAGALAASPASLNGTAAAASLTLLPGGTTRLSGSFLLSRADAGLGAVGLRLPLDADAEAVGEAVEALLGCGAGAGGLFVGGAPDACVDVTVRVSAPDGGNGRRWEITFPPSAAGVAAPALLLADASALTGSRAPGAPAVATATPGIAPPPLVATASLVFGSASSTTAAVPLAPAAASSAASSSSAALEAALEALPPVGDVDVFDAPCAPLDDAPLATRECVSWGIVFRAENRRAGAAAETAAGRRHLGPQPLLAAAPAPAASALAPGLALEVTRTRGGVGPLARVSVSIDGGATFAALGPADGVPIRSGAAGAGAAGSAAELSAALPAPAFLF